MSAAHWERVGSIAALALECAPSERTALLDRECAGDALLRQEVESLLAFEGPADGFLQQSALEEASLIAANHDVAEVADWTIDGYDIAEFLGAGGMGDVYRARDRRLERDVAIKVIRAFPGDSPATFEEEARAASALSHPNIVTIYSVGSRDELAYIVMELVQGRTLRALLTDGPLPLVTALDIALQLAEGLAAAHALGIVHRDLKPDNVMVTADGLVKILDFGIAKRERALSASPHNAAVSTPTAASTLAGTAGYMSPEQAARTGTDHRSDQFSFGAIVHEMLSGSRPGDHTPIQWAGSGVPAPLVHAIDRCLSHRPEDRYQTTRELAIEVRRIRDETTHALRQRPITRRHAIWIGAAAVLAGVSGVAAWRIVAAGNGVRRLAVLPFTNLANDESTEFLCDGITEVLIRQIERMTDVAVIGRGTAFHFKGQPHDPLDVGRQLGVDAVLNGSVARRGVRVLVDVELVNASTGIRLWSREFNSPERDVLAIQNEIAAGIITAGLGITLSPAEHRELNGSMTSDPEAYRLFLSAVHYLRLEGESNYLKAQKLLTEAVALDGAFALGHVTLGSTYSVMAIDGYQAPRDAWPLSHLHVTHALEVDHDLPDAFAERATEAFFFKWDWKKAKEFWDLALNSERNEVQAELYSSYALQQWALGRNEEALKFAQAARKVDTLSSGLALREADLLRATGRPAAAVEAYRKLIAAAPDEDRARAYSGLAEVLRSEGRFDDAIDAWRRSFSYDSDTSLEDAFAAAHGPDGYRNLERRMADFDRLSAEQELMGLQERARSEEYVTPLDFARAYARLDQHDQAFAALNKAFDEQAPGLVFLKVDRVWDGMRNDPRFAGALRRIKLA